jgi:hypothetical protein
MLYYDEVVDSIDFLDQTAFFFLSFVKYLYWSTQYLCFVLPLQEVLTITMPSSLKCLNNLSAGNNIENIDYRLSSETFYMMFDCKVSA